MTVPQSFHYSCQSCSNFCHASLSQMSKSCNTTLPQNHFAPSHHTTSSQVISQTYNNSCHTILPPIMSVTLGVVAA